jgi:RNA polymerase-binding protein DksA
VGDLTSVREGLEQRLEQLQTRVAKIEGHLRQPGHPDFAERATEAENDEVLERLDESELQEIDQIRGALERIAVGTYGSCSRCGETIAEERLQIVPYALTCVGCAA